jgi:UDP-3-O-[3-hydroxymyristoyl] glucosamine N-acyltransferase
LVTQKLVELTPGSTVAIVCDAPQLAFAQIAAAFYPTAGNLWPDKHPPLRLISPSAKIGKGTIIAPGAFIGENVEIGDGTIVGPGAVIGHGVSIGSHCKIGPQVTLAYTLIGDRVSIMTGARIGADGFGFTPGPKGLMKIPQLGRVIIQDDVEIGANTCIDRGALNDTVIGEGTKIDNLVQIAHNVRIGRHCVIAAQCGMSGSANIGDFVMMGGQVGVADHVSIASRSQIAGKSGVTKSLTPGQVYGGFPARPVKDWRREVAAVSNLARKKSSKDE